MNKLLRVFPTGRVLLIATAMAAATPLTAATAEAAPRVIDEIVVTAPRPTMTVDEMTVTAPRLSQDELASSLGITSAISRATALAAGVETQRATAREIRLAAAAAGVERG